MQRRSFLNLSLAALSARLGDAGALVHQFIPKPSRERWAVLFGTWYGTARDAGIWISEGMGGIASVFDVRQKPDLSSFDHLVVGSAIHGGRGPRELDEFIRSNMAAIEGKIRGLYVVCGNLEKPVGPQQVKDYIDGYLADLCRDPQALKKAFNGRITRALMTDEDYKTVADLYKQLGMPPLEDYDYLRRPDCLAFGREILDRAASR